ncbi:MAG: T9SS type A sorting domain-containing protein [bacterium]|nr:T9SS type A sorting domain-containing protein [bacterium]
MRQLLFLLIPMMLIGTAMASGPTAPQVTVKNVPVVVGDENVIAPVVYPPYRTPVISSVDEIGDTIKIGTTWYEDQANGTIGRMIARDSEGYLHLAWMNGLDNGANTRHIYYNFVSSSGEQGWPGTGIQVDNAQRAGYNCLDVTPDGICLPAFHQTVPPSAVNRTAVANDILPRAGGFLAWEVPDQPPPGIIDPIVWPRMQVDSHNRLHVVSTQNSASGVIQNVYYIPGTYDGAFSVTFPTGPTAWTWVDTTRTISIDVATSSVSDRVAFAWPHLRLDPPDTTTNQSNNDIFLLVDADGLNIDFSDPLNLTNFVPPDPSLLPDSARADKDSLRAYTDVSVFFDHNDYVHVAFTTHIYKAFENMVYYYSFIWHWTEQYPDRMSLVANGNFVDNYGSVPGAWNRTVQRPSLGENLSNGNLYCAYQLFDTDTLRYSAGGFASGEVYVTVSTDGGLTWAQGTNVTNTLTPENALAGECLSELDPSMAKVVDDYCHLIYVLDTDAGFVVQTEGTWTLNNVYYHRVPITAIPTTPLLPDTIPFHWYDTVGVDPGYDPTQIVKVFDLKQNYPNPFNPTTAITFSLDRLGTATLDVFNLKGELVCNLASGTFAPGRHTVAFDGTNLASGIYVYRLKMDEQTLQNKMVLLK